MLDVQFKDSWCARRVDSNASWTNWLVPGPRPPPPTPPPPPDPCGSNVTNAPQYHLTNLGVGPHDLNSIFYYEGVWHVMHQANWTDWGHLVSLDLARWTRLPSVTCNTSCEPTQMPAAASRGPTLPRRRVCTVARS